MAKRNSGSSNGEKVSPENALVADIATASRTLAENADYLHGYPPSQNREMHINQKGGIKRGGRA